MDDRILDFFKIMVAPIRLRMAAILLDETLTIDELAGRLHVRPTEIPRHLAQLEKLNLLHRAGNRYSLDNKAMESLSRSVLANMRPGVDAHSNDDNAGDFDRLVIKNFSLPDGRLKEIPVQEKKLVAILKHIAQVFEPGRCYTEKEVNETLKRFHPDTASLRRAMVDRLMISRESNGSNYWRS